MTGEVASIGYVNLDHVVAVNRPIAPGVTSLVDRRYSAPEGRLGGCAANIAIGLAGADVDVELISWMGIDPEGSRVLDELGSSRVGTDGVAREPSRRTGSTWLASAPGGESYCVYDPGGPPPRTLSATQRERLERLRRLVVAVGPPDPCGEALGLLDDRAFLLWAVKADPVSFPAALAAKLAARADVIVHNEEEARFLTDTLGDWQSGIRPDALVIQTLGADGARYRGDGASGQLEVPEPLVVKDAIGAGDRFVAGLLAGLFAGLTAEAAVRAAIDSAGRLLRGRLEHELAFR